MPTNTSPLEEVWCDYKERLRAFLGGRLRDPADVDDVLQEVLVKVHAGLSTVEDPAKLGSWMFQVTRNALVDHVRRSRPVASGEREVEAPAPQTEHEARQSLARCMLPFIDKLPSDYRASVRSVDVEGKSQKALAAELDLSHSAIKSRVQRGRAMLRQMVAQCCALERDGRGNVIDYACRGSYCRDEGD